MQWIKAAEFPEDLDLASIDEALRREQIPHRFTMESGVQVLWLAEPGNTQEVLARIQHWLKNPDSLGSLTDSKQSSQISSIGFRFGSKPAPVALAMVALSFVGASLYAFGDEFILLFTFWDPYVRILPGENVFRDILSGQYWRLMTPIFLHFSFPHVIFNALWLWYLGTMIERNSGVSRLLVLIVFVGLVSNIAQALVSSGLSIFGGMSGVVYGLLSYLWVARKLGGPRGYHLPDALFIIMTVIMLLSPLGILDWLAGGEVADTAHIVGYISGIIAALIIHLFNRPDQHNEI